MYWTFISTILWKYWIVPGLSHIPWHSSTTTRWYCTLFTLQIMTRDYVPKTLWYCFLTDRPMYLKLYIWFYVTVWSEFNQDFGLCELIIQTTYCCIFTEGGEQRSCGIGSWVVSNQGHHDQQSIGDAETLTDLERGSSSCYCLGMYPHTDNTLAKKICKDKPVRNAVNINCNIVNF